MSNPSQVSQPTIVYNGVNFSQLIPGSDENAWDGAYTTPPTYQLQGDFVYDDAGRTITHTKYVLTVESVAYTEDTDVDTPGDTFGQQLVKLTQKLSTPHKDLQINGIGLQFKDNKSVRDVLWGVKPLGVKVTPIAGMCAAFVTWGVEFNMITAIDQEKYGKDNNSIFFALNYHSSWEIDEHGLTTRTINGYYQVKGSVNKSSNRLSNVISDELREKLTFDIPIGFRRIRMNFSENLSKERMAFSFVDRQFDWNCFPVQCTGATGNFTVNAKMPGAQTGTATLTCTYEVAPGYNRGIAALHFLRAAFDRQKVMEKALRNPGKSMSDSVAGTIIPASNTVVVGQFNRVISYSLTWTLAGCLTELMYGGDIFTPVKYQASQPSDGGYVEKGTWAAWQKSTPQRMGNGESNRGVAGLSTHKPSDVIADATDKLRAWNVGYGMKVTSGTSVTPTSILCPDIPPEYSYLTYDVDFEVRALGNVDYRTYAAPLESVYDSFTSGITTITNAIPGKSYKISDSDYMPFAEHGETHYFLIMKFKSMRAQYKPKIPKPKNGNGIKWDGNLEEFIAWRSVKTKAVGTAGCHAVFMTIATYVFRSKYPILKTGEGGITTFCRSAKDSKNENFWTESMSNQ